MEQVENAVQTQANANKPPKKEKKKKEKNSKLLVPANKKGKHIMHFMNFLRVIGYPFNAVLYPFRFFGHKKVGKGAYIYVGNHYCMWDISYPLRTTWEGVHFVAKESLVKTPVVGALVRKLGTIGAKRDGSDAQTLMDCLRVLKNGEKLAIFPEGTRNRVSDEEFLPFSGGAAMLSIKTKTPIIPFVICSRPRVFRMTHVVFGEPMEFSEYYGKKLTKEDFEELDKKLMETLYSLREEHRKMLAEKKAKKRKKKEEKV